MILFFQSLDKVAGGEGGGILAPGHDFYDDYIKEIVRGYHESG